MAQPRTQQDYTAVNVENNSRLESTNSDAESSKKAERKNKLLKIITAIVFVLLLGSIAYIVYDKLSKKDVETLNPTIEPSYAELKSSFENKDNTEIITTSTKEGWRLSANGDSWEPERKNTQSFSQPIHGRLCLMITQPGEYELYSKITLKYEKASSIYHSLRHTRASSVGPGGSRGSHGVPRGLTDYIVEKNNFQWDPPMSGRMPSTLQTVDTITAGPGDTFCVETENRADIYVSRADNKFLITRLS